MSWTSPNGVSLSGGASNFGYYHSNRVPGSDGGPRHGDPPWPVPNTSLPAYGAMSVKLPIEAERPSGQSLTAMEIQQRTAAAHAVVQEHGIPNLVEQCRSGTDAEKERAAAHLSFIATHDFTCAGMIASSGGIEPLVAMLTSERGHGDEDPTIDMREQAVKTIRDMCIGDPGNVSPVAERGAIPPLLDILLEGRSPWTIREAAAETTALLSRGGDSAATLTREGKMHAVYKEAGCTRRCKEEIIKGLRLLVRNKDAKAEMARRRILQPAEQDPLSDGFAEFDAILMAAASY